MSADPCGLLAHWEGIAESPRDGGPSTWRPVRSCQILLRVRQWSRMLLACSSMMSTPAGAGIALTET